MTPQGCKWDFLQWCRVPFTESTYHILAGDVGDGAWDEV